MSPLADAAAAAGLRLMGTVAPRVPVRLGYGLAGALGALWFAVAPGPRACTIANLRVVGGEATARRARSAFAHGAKGYFDLFRLASISGAALRRQVDVVGLEHLRTALDERRGVVAATAHLGCPEAGARFAAALGLEVVCPVERLRSRRILDIMSKARETDGITCLPIGDGLWPRLTDTLARNGLVALPVERFVGGPAAELPFFGRPTRVPIVAALLAVRTGAALLPAFCRRREDGRFRLDIHTPLARSAARGAPARARAIELTEVLIGVVEHQIRRMPEQWMAFQPIWPRAGVPDRT